MRGSEQMSIFTKVLLATDGSESSALAALAALELSKRLGSEVHIIYVAREHPYLHAYHDLRHQEEEERFNSEDERMLGESVEYVRKAGGAVTESYLRVGEAAKEIVELAEELGAGLVVLGSNGRGRIRRTLMGSVSTSVLRHAHCSVLIARGYGPNSEHARPPGKILVAIDGSEEASTAAEAATPIAKATGSDAHLVYAMQEERYRPHLGPEMWEGWEEGFEHAKRSARSWVEEEEGGAHAKRRCQNRRAAPPVGASRCGDRVVGGGDRCRACRGGESRPRRYEEDPHRQRLRFRREACPLPGHGGTQRDEIEGLPMSEGIARKVRTKRFKGWLLRHRIEEIAGLEAKEGQEQHPW
jgi:nucleotide-binding universal stress UspA family protein